MTAWPPLTRDDLTNAKSRAGFDMVFPILIRRLIRETAIGLTELDMPGGSGVASGGFDGVTTCDGSSPFVPSVRAVWELSVGGGNSKADDDYAKRTEGPEGSAPSEVTYVQVILEPWTKARSWQAQRRNEGRWRDVRAFNLDQIHTWLESAPGTAAWLAEELGVIVPGVRTLERWWYDTWLPSTTTPLGPECVLAGRKQAVDSLRLKMASSPRRVVLGCGLRPEEAWAFLAAALTSSDDPTLRQAASRSLIVTDAATCASLAHRIEPIHLLVADPTVARDLPASHPHTLVLLGGKGAVPDVQVPAVNGEDVASALKAAGFERERAESLGIVARRSLLVLRRALAAEPSVLIPVWAREPGIIQRRLALIGGWDGASEQDREIVARLTRLPYVDLQERVRELSTGDSAPMLGCVGQRWYLLDRSDTWSLIAPHFTSDDLKELQQAAIEVLGEADPLYGLDESERIAAGMRGVGRKHSSALREALAESLALLGSDDGVVGNGTGNSLAAHAVRELLVAADADESYGRWASLGDVLPLLAEAVPDVFLRQLGDELESEATIHSAMFGDEGDSATGFPPQSPHLAVLNALEVVAWSNRHLDLAVDILARLADIDPGGRWSNRPAESLVSILNCWAPQSSASVDQRHRAVARVVRDLPAVGFPLLVSLIPDGRGFQMLHSGPRFRDWKERRIPTWSDVHTAVDGYSELLLAALGQDVNRFVSVLPKLGRLSGNTQIEFANRVGELGPGLDNEARVLIFEPLREMLARHREYRDAAWSLPEERLAPLDSALAAVTPRDAVLRNHWLFASGRVSLGDLQSRDDFSAYERTVQDRQRDAMTEIVAAGGLGSVFALARDCKYPYSIGAALADAAPSHDSEMSRWLGLEQSVERPIASAYFTRRFASAATSLLDELVAASHSHQVRARLLLASRSPEIAWPMLENLDAEVANVYWREFEYYGLGPGFTGCAHVVESLIAVGRFASALEAAQIYKLPDTAEGADLVATALEGLLAARVADPEIARSPHEYEEHFAFLARHRDSLGMQRLVHLEWQLFPLLGFEADAPTLHRALAKEPLFFAELVSYAFKPDARDAQRDGEDDQGASDTARERRRSMAIRAYEVLRTWRRCPGVKSDGTVDPSSLNAWVSAARERLRVDNHLSAGDAQIGEVLAHAPDDDDGTHPPLAVRDLLEQVRSSRIEDGLYLGIVSSRGVTSRSLTEGGAQEWERARDFLEKVDALEEWPRTRRVFEAVASSYEGAARRQDGEAERHKLGLWT